MPDEPLSEINRRAIAIFIRELGPADAMTLLGQFSTGRGDYTEERRTLFEELTIDQLLRDIEGLTRRESKPPSTP